MQSPLARPSAVLPSPSPMPPSDMSVPALGHAIGERYRIDRKAGRSTAGLVFEGTDRIADRRVAIEVASSIEEPGARITWAHDARMVQRLEGEHVLHVLDIGTLPDGVPYAVREIAVATLASELEARGTLPVQEAVGWTLDACVAVAEAHARGMVHGDLRLETIHLARGERGMTVKVAWTREAKTEGSVKEAVARDIRALGALLRVLITGRFDPEVDNAPTLPSDVANVVARALAQDAEGAFQNIAELARALAPCAPPGHGAACTIAFMLSRAGIISAPIPLPPAPPGRPSRTDEGLGSRSSFAPASNGPRTAVALVSLALLGFVLGGSWFLWQNGRLPRWNGDAAPDEVGRTHVTSAPVVPPTIEAPKRRLNEATPPSRAQPRRHDQSPRR